MQECRSDHVFNNCQLIFEQCGTLQIAESQQVSLYIRQGGMLLIDANFGLQCKSVQMYGVMRVKSFAAISNLLHLGSESAFYLDMHLSEPALEIQGGSVPWRTNGNQYSRSLRQVHAYDDNILYLYTYQSLSSQSACYFQQIILYDNSHI